MTENESIELILSRQNEILKELKNNTESIRKLNDDFVSYQEKTREMFDTIQEQTAKQKLLMLESISQESEKLSTKIDNANNDVSELVKLVLVNNILSDVEILTGTSQVTQPKPNIEKVEQLCSEHLYKDAFEMALPLAENGNIKAMYLVGEMYYNASGIIKDRHEAAKWYGKSAKQGYADAQHKLGNCYFSGSGGIRQDYHQAVKWYRKSAEQGNVEAQERLAFCYFYGHGVTKDCIEAEKWYKKAAEQSNEKSCKTLIEIGW